MKNLKVIFDCDDILWPLNKRMAKMAGIDFDKLYTYSIKDNVNFTEEERNKIINIYGSTELFKNINWYDGIDRIKYLDADIFISTNCYTEDIAKMKRQQLKEVLKIPDDKIYTHVINNEKRKLVDDDAYIFIDDSPYNRKESNALFNILMKKPWNITKESDDLMSPNRPYKCDTLNDIIDLVIFLIDKSET
jgi:hypothetical protein